MAKILCLETVCGLFKYGYAAFKANKIIHIKPLKNNSIVP